MSDLLNASEKISINDICVSDGLAAAPEFVERLNVFEEVESGGHVTFQCQVRAFPRPIVKWFKDDVELTSLTTTEDQPTGSDI